jgi:hypothetical protein
MESSMPYFSFAKGASLTSLVFISDDTPDEYGYFAAVVY